MPEAHDVTADAPTRLISGFTTIWGVTINPSALAMGVLVLAIIAFLAWAHWRRHFSVFDLITDRMPDGTQKASGIKFSFLSAFILSSWVIFDQEIKLKLAEGMFGLYLATWCASLIAKVVFDKKDMPDLPKMRETHE
jgi:aconitase B